MNKRIRFDLTANAINQGMKEGFVEELKEHLSSMASQIVSRQGELPPYIAEMGPYSNLMEEARKCYEFGLFHAAVSMIGIAAERFCMDLSHHLKFFVNEHQLLENELYDRGLKQPKRLAFLLKSKLITDETHKLLDEVRIVRNKYIHPSEIGDAKEDALNVIKKFTKVIKSEFSEKYEIREGKMVQK